MLSVRQVAPEAQLLTAPLVQGLLLGLHSLIDSGMSGCNSGFGSRCWREREGMLSYQPADDKTSSGATSEFAHLSNIVMSPPVVLPHLPLIKFNLTELPYLSMNDRTQSRGKKVLLD